MQSFHRNTRRLLPLLIAAVLSSGSALAASTPKPAKAPTAQQQSAREEIERLTKRIEELSQQLGDDGQVRVIVKRVGPGEGPGDGDVVIRRIGPGDAPEAMRDFHWHDRDRDGERGRGLRDRRLGLGVVLAPNSAASGVKIVAVTPDSPAMRAGLHSGDIVLSIDGKKIAGSGEAAVDTARKMLGDLKQDQVVKIGYARAGKTGTVSVKADQIHRVMVFDRGEGAPRTPRAWKGDDDRVFMLPEKVQMDIERIGPMRDCAPGKDDCHLPALAEAFRWQGLNLASIDASLGRYFGSSEGVLVISSGDELKGLQSGDVIQRVGGVAVKSPRDVMRALRDKDEGQQLKLDVLRDRKTVAVSIAVPKSRPLPFMIPPPPPPAAPPAPPATPRTPGVAPTPAPSPAAAPPPPPRPSVAFISTDDPEALVEVIRDLRVIDGGDGDEEIEIITVPSR
ncbi:PDZ domain-containing protein [Arenimonas sp.]|uniref:PDZ domain-containing protein n=1 Tax=Arenimonas sp. TaxID=1872635 RepID=UPI0039E32BBC